MRPLPFRLPDFTRIAWSSAAARQVWEPRMAAFGTAWDRIERESVLTGRSAALQPVPPSRLPDLAAWAATEGLAAVPVAFEGEAGPYAQTPMALEPGKPWHYRVVLARPATAASFAAAWGLGDDDAIGELLGYPPCCRFFFRRVWGPHVDTTWHMAEGGTAGPPEANILLRWLGVRLVPHLPCSFDCQWTAQIGRNFVAVGEALGFRQEIEWALEMLSWPVEWSALHGIAELRTPVCRAVTRTDATADELVVRRAGTRYPEEGATGLRFPYRPGPHAKPAPPGELRVVRPAPAMPRPWDHDGFAGPRARELAHAVVAAAAAGPLEGPVLDLGCGSGALAARIGAAAGVPALGVEIDPIRAAAARRRLDPEHVIDGPIEGEWPGTPPYGLALVMPGRLLEMEAVDARRLRFRLARSCRSIVLYAYGDWLQREGGLAPLAQAAGFGDVGTWEWGPISRGEGVEAMRARSRRTASESA